MSVFAIDGQTQAMKAWRSGTSVLHHNLPQDPRFSLPALASLIEGSILSIRARYVRHRQSLRHAGWPPNDQHWSRSG